MSKILSVVCIFAFLAGSECLAQITTADVIGTVTDASGATLPNATVSLENLDTHDSRTAMTDDSGAYVFTFLPVGRYALKVVAAGVFSFQLDFGLR